MLTVMVTAPQRDAARIAELGQRYPSVRFVVPSNRAEAYPFLAETDVVFGSVKNEEFHAAEKLRWIQASSAGVEWMASIEGLIESDVVVTNTRGAHAATIAEHAFSLLLSLTRSLPIYAEYQRREEWARGKATDGMVGIKGLTLGIVGFGNIGRALARRATGFEMRVLAVDAIPGAPSDGVQDVWGLDRLDDLCGASDVLAIAAPITPQTRGMIGADQIGKLRPHGYLLALSRGGIVDEAALLQALAAGTLAGAGIDVTATEPLPPGHPLWKAPNLLLTPHSSPVSKLTAELVWSILGENLGHFLNGEPLINLVDKRLGY